MEEGRIVGWMIEVGQSFKRWQSILEVETDKTIVEFPALGAGVLEEVLAVEGDVITVGDAVGMIDFGDGNDWTTENDIEVIEAASSETQETPQTQVTFRTANAGIRATPVARTLARQGKMNLQDVRGTGRRGRIEASDVQTAQTAGSILSSARADIRVLEK